MTTALLVAAIIAGQAPLPPELRQREDPRHKMDPFLPDVLRTAVARASEAELDEKRGPGNAKQILETELRKHAGDRALEFAIQVRIAATVLRSNFRNFEAIEEGQRYQQALSTYSKLDITDPGLREWIKLTLDHNPDAAKSLKGRSVKVAILGQGEGLDKKKLFRQLADHFSRTGFTAKPSPVKGADFVLKVTTLSSRRPGEKAVVRGTIEAESALDKTWRRSLFRAEQAENPARAHEAVVEWLVRAAAREVFFRFLREALPFTEMQPPPGASGGGHAGHGAQGAPTTVRIPKAEGQKPPPR